MALAIAIAAYAVLGLLAYAIFSVYGRGLRDLARYVLLPLAALVAVGAWILPAIPAAVALLMIGVGAGLILSDSAS